MQPARMHTIIPGETLTSIARKYGLSWKAVYFDPSNADFRRRCPNPNVIRTGDRVAIPSDPVAILNQRLVALRQLRTEASTLFVGMEMQANRDFQEIQAYGIKVDIAAAALNIIAGLAHMCVDGYKTLGLAGQKLEEANRKFARTYLAHGTTVTTQGTEVIRDAIIERVAEPSGEDGLVWGLGKVLLNSYLDMQSPSYWATRATGGSIEDQHRRTLQTIQQTRAAMLQQIDGRIREAEQEIRKEQSEKMMAVPVR